MILAPLLSALLLGLAGSLHCIGMCGPLALAIPGAVRRGNPALLRFYYHGGRAVTYAFLGLLVGGLGEAFRQSGWPQVLSIICGVVLLMSWVLKKWLSQLKVTRGLMSALQRVTVRYIRDPHPEAMWIAGMLNGLLPCGLVYTAMAASTLMPSAPLSALYMLIFGAGTIPALYAVSSARRCLHKPGRVRWSWATPVLTMVAGVFLILRGLSLGIPVLSPAWHASADEPGACCPHTAAEEVE